MRRIYLIDCPGVVYPSGDSETDIILKGVVSHMTGLINVQELDLKTHGWRVTYGGIYIRKLNKAYNDKDASKSVALYFNLPVQSRQHMTVGSLSLHQGNRESRGN